jgi:serine/threonine-protein phosphatase 2A activator
MKPCLLIDLLFMKNIEKLVAGLGKISALVDTVAPIPQAMRYGNKAFQLFLDKLEENVETLHKEMLPESAHPAIIELSVYFSESFGNRIRIDYGTGPSVFRLFILPKLK